MTSSVAAAASPTTTAPARAPVSAPAAPHGAFRSLLLGRAAQAGRAGPAQAASRPPAATPVAAAGARGPGRGAADPAGCDGLPAAATPHLPHLPHAKGEMLGRDKHASPPDHDAGSLDPAARHAAQLAPPAMAGGAVEAAGGAPEVHARASLEHLLPALVKKVAWAGDGKRGSVRMELGAGALAGATVMVHADGGRVRVEIDAPAGADRDAWKARIAGRLAASGLDVEHVEIT